MVGLTESELRLGAAGAGLLRIAFRRVGADTGTREGGGGAGAGGGGAAMGKSGVSFGRK